MSPPSSIARGFGAELRASALLALPLSLGHLSSGLIGFVDSAIAGHHARDASPGTARQATARLPGPAVAMAGAPEEWLA